MSETEKYGTDQLKKDILRLHGVIEGLERRLAMLEETPVKKEVINKDGIPVGMHIFSELDDLGVVELVVRQRNYQAFKIGQTKLAGGKKFNSLSAAAEAISGIKRKSGWQFWRDENGRTLKELFKS